MFDGTAREENNYEFQMRTPSTLGRSKSTRMRRRLQRASEQSNCTDVKEGIELLVCLLNA